MARILRKKTIRVGSPDVSENDLTRSEKPRLTEPVFHGLRADEDDFPNL